MHRKKKKVMRRRVRKGKKNEQKQKKQFFLRKEKKETKNRYFYGQTAVCMYVMYRSLGWDGEELKKLDRDVAQW